MENVLEGFDINGDFMDEVSKLCLATEEKRNMERNMSWEERSKKNENFVNRIYSIPPEQKFYEDVITGNNSNILSCIMNINEIKKQGKENCAFDVIIKWLKEYMLKTHFEENKDTQISRCNDGILLLDIISTLLRRILIESSHEMILFPTDYIDDTDY